MEDRIQIFGEEIVDKAAIEQFKNCMTEDSLGVITADCHKGYSLPVGGCIAYKNLEEVLSYQGETIKVLHRLKPIGVAMAGETEFDPYKD